MVTTEIRIQILRAGARIPAYSHGPEEDAGADLVYCGTEPVTLQPGERHPFPTGIAIELPPGYEGQVRPRSGLARKKGITLANSPGTIDPGYRGEIQVVLVNLDREPQTIEPSERIAQLIVAQYVGARFTVAESLASSERGAGGFGSTGSR